MVLRASIIARHPPQLALHAQLELGIDPWHVLDLVVAWEEVNRSQYDRATGRFLKMAPKDMVVRDIPYVLERTTYIHFEVLQGALRSTSR